MKHEGQGCLHSDKLEGRYANYFKVGHNEFEFVMEFGQFYEGSERGDLYAEFRKRNQTC